MGKNNITSIIIATVVVVVALLVACIFAFFKYGGSPIDKPSNQASETITQNSVEPDIYSTEYKNYMTYVGEDYDRYFIATMIAHHEGAVSMAKLALNNSQHQELKDLSNTIILSQTNEINNMLVWQKAWGFPVSSGYMMMDHSAMGIEDDNQKMMERLQTKSGNAFDVIFLEQMIAHHKSALNKAAPGKTNAQHQEVKDLTATILSTQAKEIQQMKQFQKAWGYNASN